MSEYTPPADGLRLPTTDPRRDLSTVGALALLLRDRRLLVGVFVGAIALAAGTGLLPGREYATTASFIPSSGPSQVSRLSGIAAQFGLALPLAGDEAGQSPAFYADLVETRGILEELASSEFLVDGRDAPARLVDIYDLDEEEPGRRREEIYDRLREHIDAGVLRETGVVEVHIRARTAGLAHDMAARLLELLNEFNLNRRRTQASAERAFIEARLEDVTAELRAAEARQEAFLEANKSIGSPSLRFEHGRLEREAVAHQQVVLSLRQSYEQARIDEVRNIPLITVVQEPYVPAKPMSRYLLLRMALGGVAGLGIGLVLVLGREFMRRSRVLYEQDYQQLAAELKALGRREKRPA